MISKKVLFLLAFLFALASANATIDAELLIYYKYNYIQGPFKHQDELKQSNNSVLLPEFQTVMFLQNDNVFKKIFSLLKGKNPQLYNGVAIELRDSLPVVIVTDTSVIDFEAVKNELLASFSANSDIKEVNFIVNNVGKTFKTTSISYPIFAFKSSDPKLSKEAPIDDALFNLPLWISIALNIFLIIYLIVNNKNRKASSE